MKVHIEGNLYLESDELSFIIREYTGKTDKQGKKLCKTHGYFNSIQAAVKHIVKMKVKESTANTLSELIQDVERIEQWIESKLSV